LYTQWWFRLSFFGLWEKLDHGCIHVVVKEGDMIFIPGGWFHFVCTDGDSVAYGVNFVTLPGLPRAIMMFSQERREDRPFEECFPHFEALIILALIEAHQQQQSDDAVVPTGKAVRLFKSGLEAVEQTETRIVAELIAEVRFRMCHSRHIRGSWICVCIV
jgi:hypothetical protein